ncbi:MAG TPA: hypothetical protein VK589_14180 [Chryseolinea sp.]|nr:hypothetical protein [Chryseolinea sp.]
MIVLQIEHNVSTYDGWKKAFDSDPIGRKRLGVKRYQVYQSADDPNYVVVDLYFNSLEDSVGALKSLQELWSKVQGTVMVNPKARMLNLKETVEL